MTENFFLKYQNRAEKAETKKKPAPKSITWTVFIVTFLCVGALFYSLSNSIYVYSKYKIINSKSQENLAYCQAARSIKISDLSNLELLLDKFPQLLNHKSSKGDTLLFEAAKKKNGLRSAALLLSKGADPMVRTKNGFLAIHAYPGNRETIKLLEIHGLKLDIFAAAGHGFLEDIENLIKSDPCCLNYRDPAGLTALEHAAWNNNHKAARALIEHGAKVDIISAARMGYADKAKQLLLANPELANFLSENNPYQTPLQAAIISGSSQIVNLLLENGAKIEAQKSDIDYLELACRLFYPDNN